MVWAMPPVDEILFSRSPGEDRFALMADGRPVDFLIDRGAAEAGAVILGRVKTVNRGLDAAFVDIGEPLPGFLPSPGPGHGEGAAVLVQVAQGARGDKGAVLDPRPSLKGRLVAYTPFRAGLSLSKRIDDPARRAALKGLLKPRLEEGEGLVVRTEAAHAGDGALLDELMALRVRWRGIAAEAARARPPARLSVVSSLARLLAAHPGVVRLAVDDRAALAEAKALFPAAHFDEGVFDREAGEALDQALTPVVPLPDGGRLTIETTAAFVAIDIDSGPGAPLAANLAAIPEIARQLRLRNLSGHILIDLIPVKDRQVQARLLAGLRRAVAEDPVPTHIVGMTPLGAVEMTREHVRPSLAEVMREPADAVPNAETLALAALRDGLKAALHRPSGRIAVEASPAVAAALSRRQTALDEAARRLGRPLAVRTRPDVETYRIVEES